MSYGAQDCTASSYALYTGADGGIAFYIFDGSLYRISAAAAPADVWDGGWHHVAGVASDNKTLRLFVDGQLAAETKGPGLFPKKPALGLQLGAPNGSPR